MQSPLFLYTGPEFGERNDAIADFRQQIEKKYGALDYHLLYAADTSVQDVLTLLENGNLFSDARFIVLRNAEQIKKKEDIALIEQWKAAAEKQQNNDAWLFLVSDENSVDKKLENIVAKENKKVFWEMFEDRKEQWLRNFIKRNGFDIEDEAIDSILNMVENNTEALRNECSRFFSCFSAGHVVTEKDVDDILAHNREESAFTLFAALADNSKRPAARLETSLEILQKIRQSKDSGGVQLIAGLTWCFRKLRSWINLCRNGYASEFDLKTNGFSSKKMQQQYRGAANIWNARQVEAVLSLLSETDMAIRSGGTALEHTQLQTMIYAIVCKAGTSLEKYEADEL